MARDRSNKAASAVGEEPALTNEITENASIDNGANVSGDPADTQVEGTDNGSGAAIGQSGAGQVPVGDAPKTSKSIVPSRYAGRYKPGQANDDLGTFILGQCNGKEGFEFPAFFQLCRDNGISNEHVGVYEKELADKKHGAPGRARMTLRNRLAGIARKQGKLKDLSGNEHEITLPPLPKREKATEQAA